MEEMRRGRSERVWKTGKESGEWKGGVGEEGVGK